MAATVPVHRLSVEDVYAMVRAQILEENARVELVEGVLVMMNPIGPEHRSTMKWLNKHFVRACNDRYDVAIQDMLLTTDEGYRLPDLVVTEPLGRHELPSTALLVIEVAQTSQGRDREKIADYARAGVLEYWIVDLVDEVVHVHTEPADDVYRTVVAHRRGEVATQVPGVPPVPLDVLFGR